ncbi:Bestrophin-2-like 4, partial [Homarus americanus]
RHTVTVHPQRHVVTVHPQRNVVTPSLSIPSVTSSPRHCPSPASRRHCLSWTFEHLSLYCDYFRNLIPISFVLGFYVTVVVQRWWEQYLCIPWPDDFAMVCASYIRGKQGTPRALRATLIRYVNLASLLTFAKISPKVQKKFPTYKEILEAGYLTAHEMRILEQQKGRTSVPLVLLPIMWSCKMVESATTSGYVRDNFGLKFLLEELIKLRNMNGMLLRWNDMSIPLVYTQVVTMAVYSFFFFSVLGRQFLDPQQKYTNRTIDFFIPIFTLLQFFFYMGWLKVAESLVNPFGEDDDDFDLDLILERHLKMSYLMGDVTPSEDPLSFDDSSFDKAIPGLVPGAMDDLGRLHDLGRDELNRANHHRGDLGREDLNKMKNNCRSDHGRDEHDQRRGMHFQGNLGWRDKGRSDLKPSNLGGMPAECSRSAGSDLDTVIMSPDPPQQDKFNFVWEEMDLSAPHDSPKKTRDLANTLNDPHTGSGIRGEEVELGTSYQVHTNQGRTSPYLANQDHGHQTHGNQGHANANQGRVSPYPINNQGLGNQEHSTLRSVSPYLGNQDHDNQSHGNQISTNPAITNANHTAQSYGNQSNGNQVQSNMVIANQGNGNQVLSSRQRQQNTRESESNVDGIENPMYTE